MVAKVLHVSNFQNRGGGTALARQLAANDPGNSTFFFLEREGGRSGPAGSPPEYVAHAHDFAFLRQVAEQMIARDGGVIVHGHGRRSGLWGQMLRALHPRRVRVVLSFHGIASFAGLKKYYVASHQVPLSLLTDQYIAAAPAETTLFRYLPLAAPMVTIPNSYNPGNLAPWTPRPVRRIGFCGRFERPKLQDGLVRAVALHNSRNSTPLTLVLSGDGSLRADVDALGQALLGEHYVSLGHVPDISGFYRRIDAFAHFSRFEGMPLALLDALACGMPCIASDVIGCRDVIERDVSGLLVPVGDDNAAATALQALAQQPELAQRLAANGRRRAEDHFSPRIFWRRHAEIYDRLRAGIGRRA